jgi:hypothetical protein
VDTASYIAACVVLPLGAGLALRRWWALAIPAVVFSAYLVGDALDGGLDPGIDWTVGQALTVFAITVLADVPRDVPNGVR